MFFHELETIVSNHPDLLRVVERVDQRLSRICSPSPLRPGDFACVVGAAMNQVQSVFELLAYRGLLSTERMVECERCQGLLSAAAFDRAITDEDDVECTGCGHVLHRRSTRTVVYRMTDEALCRTRANAKPIEIQVSEVFGLKPFDGSLSDSEQCILIAMLALGALDSDSRRTTSEITVRAFGHGADANAQKSVMAELKGKQLIDSKTGRGGGCWLTDSGRRRAEKLHNRSGNSATV